MTQILKRVIGNKVLLGHTSLALRLSLESSSDCCFFLEFSSIFLRGQKFKMNCEYKVMISQEGCRKRFLLLQILI